MTRPPPHLGWIAITLLIVGAAGVAAGADSQIFSDGFESGDTSKWVSTAEPPRPTFRLSTDTIDLSEGAGEANLAVELDPPASTEVSVRVATAGDSAAPGADYWPVDEVLTFLPGQSSLPIVIDIVDDLSYEPEESFSVHISEPSGGVLGEPTTATITISQSDWPPFVYLGDGGGFTAEYDAFEQFPLIVVPVRLSQPSGIRAAVEFTSAGGTATDGEDFQGYSGTLVFEPGEFEKLIEIPIYDDGIPDTGETIHLTLSNAVDCTLDGYLPYEGFVTIRDDLWVSFVESEMVIAEETHYVAIVVNLSVPLEEVFRVALEIDDVSAIAGEDYSPVSSLISFSPGSTSKGISVLIVGDSDPEGDETFSVSFGDVSGVPIVGRSTVTVTILDDDVPEVAILPPSQSTGEGSGSVSVGVSLSFAASTDVTVDFATADGTAHEGLDFQGGNGTLLIPEGETGGNFPIAILEDGLIEGKESFTVTLTGAQGAAVRSNGTVTVTIIDDELRAVVGEPEGRVYGDGDVLTMDGSGSVIPPDYEMWFAVLRDDGSDFMDVVQIAGGLTDSFMASEDDAAYRVRLVIAAPGFVPEDGALRGASLPCADPDPPSSCTSDEVTIERADLNTFPFTTSYVFPDAVLLVWGGSSTPSMELERSSDGGNTWVAFPEPGNQDRASGVETYRSYADRTTRPGTTYHYRIKWNTFSEWFYLGNTFKAPGDPVITPVWTAPRPVPVFESVMWNCPEGASRFLCFGTLTLSLNPEPGESLAGTTIGVFLNETTFEALDGEGGDVPIIWPETFPFSGRDEPGCVERQAEPDLVIEIPEDQDSITIDLPNVVYGANSFRFVVDDGQGGFSERALLYGIHDEVGEHLAIHDQLLPLLFGTEVSVEDFQLRGLGPVGIRSPDCADGDWRKPSYWTYNDNIYAADVYWYNVTAGRMVKNHVGTDENGGWTTALSLSDGVDHTLKMLKIHTCDPLITGHIGRSILAEDGSPITTTETVQEVCAGYSPPYPDQMHVDTSLEGPHPPALDFAPASFFSLSDDEVVIASIRFRITDLHHDVDVSSVTITNESLEPPDMAYGFYAEDQLDSNRGDWGWFVAEVPMALPPGEASFDNALRIQAVDLEGFVLNESITVMREKPLVWAEIAEPDPPEAEPREIVTFDGTGSIVPAIDELGGGVARWFFFHQVAGNWRPYRDPGFADGSAGLIHHVAMPRESALKARLVVAVSLLDIPSDPWAGGLPCAWDEGDGRCDSEEVIVPLAEPMCIQGSQPLSVVIDSSVEDVSGERRGEFHFDVHAASALSPIAYRWTFYDAEDTNLEWPVGDPSRVLSSWAPSNSSVDIRAEELGLLEGDYFLLAEARYPEDGCDEAISQWMYGKSVVMSVRVNHEFGGIAPGEIVEGSGFRVYSRTWQEGQTGYVFIDDVVGDDDPSLVYSGIVEPGGFVQVLPDVFDVYSRGTPWYVSLATDSEGAGRSVWWGGLKVAQGGRDSPIQVTNEEDPSCGGVGTECTHQIVPGQTMQGNWQQPGDADYFGFAAGAGTVVRVGIERAESGHSAQHPDVPVPEIFISRPDGLLTAASEPLDLDDTGAELKTTLTLDGYHQIVVRTPRGSGDYLLTLDKIDEGGNGESVFGWTDERVHLTTDPSRPAHMTVPLIDGFGNPLSGGVVVWERGESCGAGDFCGDGLTVEARSSVNGFAYLDHDPEPGGTALWRPKALHEISAKKKDMHSVAAARVADARRFEAILGYIQASSGAVSSANLPNISEAKRLTESARFRAKKTSAKKAEKNESWCSQEQTCAGGTAPVFSTVRLELDEGDVLVDVELSVVEGGVPTERLDGHEVMTSVDLTLVAEAVIRDSEGAVHRLPIDDPVAVSVVGDRGGAIDHGGAVCDDLQLVPGPFTFLVGSDAGVDHIYDEPDGSPCCWIPTELLIASVIADVEIENGQGQPENIRKDATIFVESIPRPADPCEVRFYPADRPIVNTNRLNAHNESGDAVSLGRAYLTDACGNVVHGFGQNDSEYHDQPGDEFRIVSPLEPPGGVSGVWATAQSTTDDWSFPLTLRGRSDVSATHIPDGVYTVQFEVASQSQCSTGGSIPGSLTVEAFEFLPQLTFHWDWDFDGEVSLRGPDPKYSVIAPGSTVFDASDRVAVWRVPAYDEPDPIPYFEGSYTSVPVKIFVARADTVPINWDGDLEDTYLEPVEGVVLCTGIVEEMTDSAGTVMAWQGPVRSTCDQTWTTVAEGFASSDPEMTNQPPDTWVPIGLGVGIVKAPEHPGTYVLVVEPADEAFRRNNSWRIDSLIWPDNFMEFEVGGGVYLDEEYERFGATIDVPEARQVYVQAKLDSEEPTLTLDVEYTDPDDESTDTRSITVNRMGESNKGGSVYLSEPIELVPEGLQKIAKSGPSLAVKVDGTLASRYLETLVAFATIENDGPVDLDIDGDNNNGSGLPDRSSREEDLETGGGYGKFVFVNHNDDDGDGVPDYADLDNPDEGNFVPVVLKIDIPDVEWADVFVTFEFDGLNEFFGTAYVDIKDPRDQSSPTGFRDHRSAKRAGDLQSGWYYPQMRLWSIEDPNQYRYPENLVIPGAAYSATELGFGQGESPNQVVLYVEGINPGGGLWSAPQPTTIDVEVTAGEQSFSDLVGLTVVEVNLGVNNSSHEPFDDEFTVLGTLRPGVPDVGFLIDQYDEIAEDQGKGLAFWKRAGRNAYRPIDMFPMVVDVPSALQGSGYRLKLRVDGEDSTFAILNSPSKPDDLIQHLRVDGYYDYLIDQIHFRPQLLSQWELPQSEYGYRHTLLVLPLFSDDLTSESSITVRLVGVDRDSHEIPLDSFRLTLQPMTWFETAWNGVFWMGSSRGQPSGEYDYPADVDSDGLRVVQSIPIYPEVEWFSGPNPDLDRRNYVVFVHGYNVNPDQAFESAAELYKRLWWSGYRGNFIGFTWHGDEFDPLKHSCPDIGSGLCAALFFPNVQNAFQTSPRLTQFLNQTVQGAWGASAENVYLVAHSLGNLVALDSLRLHSVNNGGANIPLIRNMVSIEAAVWAETFRPQASFEYDTSLGSEYAEDDLKRNSWAFWFNQSESPVSSAVQKMFNSYVPLDIALFLMRANDTLATYELGFLSGPRLEYGTSRGVPLNYRVPIGDGVPATEPENRPDLWFEIPPLTVNNLSIGQKARPADLTRALGAVPNTHPDAINIFAGDFGWREFKHSDFLDLSLPEIWPWYQEMFKKREELDDRGILPVGEE